VQLSGHAIECRLNAEDPAHDFRPSPGRVSDAHFPAREGLRYDTHIETGASIPPFYDSMVAKVIAHGETREDARQRLLQALEEVRLEGVKTNLQLHKAVLQHPEFCAGGVDTGFLGRYLATEPQGVLS
jgi:acetyl-CoA carboxylase biotin carboxylase subunit